VKVKRVSDSTSPGPFTIEMPTPKAEAARAPSNDPSLVKRQPPKKVTASRVVSGVMGGVVLPERGGQRN
jgi:hypothetical protein